MDMNDRPTYTMPDGAVGDLLAAEATRAALIDRHGPPPAHWERYVFGHRVVIDQMLADLLADPERREAYEAGHLFLQLDVVNGAHWRTINVNVKDTPTPPGGGQ